MFFIFSVATIFNTSWASAGAADVKNFAQLKKAVEDGKSEIKIVSPAIEFNEAMAISRNNITISGTTGSMVKFDGRDSSRFFVLDKDRKGILFRNIKFIDGEFDNGEVDNVKGECESENDSDDSDSDDSENDNSSDNDSDSDDNNKIGGGAFLILANTSAIFENTLFSGNVATKSSGGAIFSAKNSILIFRGRAKFDNNVSKEDNGGAIFAAGSSGLTFEGETIFKNNISLKSSGAIYLGKKSALVFREATTFDSNANKLDFGGAVCARNSSITFEREAIFRDNESHMGGGAIASLVYSTLVFRGVATFDGNKSTSGVGGAILSSCPFTTFEGEAIFRNNKSLGSGGAIAAAGNTMIFRGAATFDSNESGRLFGSGGGAVCVTDSSSLTFEKEAIFRNNKSSKDGGAIALDSTGGTLVFRGAAIFDSNESESSGGAVYGHYCSLTNLTFEGEAIFRNNKSSEGGGAVYTDDNRLLFRERAIFEDNKSKEGGAIFVSISGDLNFNSGLRLINNITRSKDRLTGAIHMNGSNSEEENEDHRAKVTIVQKDPLNSTIFKGNKSNDGCVAVYMEEYSVLNFLLEKGDVDLYDAIDGDRTKNSNTVTLEGSGGQFNLKEEGSINNVNLINRGNLNLAESQTAARPLSFRNSGKIIFGIFPENNRCSGIQAENIILEEGTTLEIAVAGGDYTAGNSYDIMVSNNAIKKPENINIILPQTLPQGLRARTELQDKLYRILIEID
ncbi:MAG: hypothetical protein LBP39_00745, partial [Rickettsiales bacterium]|nr:hypothetical protein [Rickettsiales bacterium]